MCNDHSVPKTNVDFVHFYLFGQFVKKLCDREF